MTMPMRVILSSSFHLAHFCTYVKLKFHSLQAPSWVLPSSPNLPSSARHPPSFRSPSLQRPACPPSTPARPPPSSSTAPLSASLPAPSDPWPASSAAASREPAIGEKGERSVQQPFFPFPLKYLFETRKNFGSLIPGHGGVLDRCLLL